MGWSFLVLHGIGAVVSLRSQQGIGLLEGRVMTGRLFNGFKRKDVGSAVECLALVTRTSTSSPLNCLCAAQASLYQHSISVLGDLLNAFAGDLQLLHMHEGVEDYLRLTLYWPYCRSFRVEGFSPRNPILPWVRATLSWCRMFWV